ncbi:MAG: barstar family protein [Saprospiraceae bacterium]|nr:barstar family protein [Saprospiraceae bacterium]
MEIHENTIPHLPETAFIAEIDGSKVHTLRGFYPRIASALVFPDYFGKNLDALFDCLCSLEVVGRPEIILLIRHFDLFLDKEKPEKRVAALQILADAEKSENRYDDVLFRVIGLRD